VNYILIVLSSLLLQGTLLAQTQPAAVEWQLSRTTDGKPDLQGFWTTQTYTPFERPERFDGREFLTDEEFAELTEILTAAGVDPLGARRAFTSDTNDIEERRRQTVQRDPTHYDNSTWLRTTTPKSLSSRRTSLVINPSDGRIPALSEEGRKRATALAAARGFDGYESRPYQERCLVWTHEGPPMTPPPYNDLYQIIQTPGYVVLLPELRTNAVRIIPTDGRPHLSSRIRQWPGDSRGRWEGNTLVVETTNFDGRSAFRRSSSSLHVVERFTRTAADMILYEFTVEDPTTWTRPWSVEMPMIQTEGPIYEYTCHEGNYGLVNTLRGARKEDREAR